VTVRGYASVSCQIARVHKSYERPCTSCLRQEAPESATRHHDGTVSFVRNALDAPLDAIIAEVLEDLFGPEPAEDRHILMPEH
jgi:hypothetical protein